jgi:hypothetical protein
MHRFSMTTYTFWSSQLLSSRSTSAIQLRTEYHFGYAGIFHSDDVLQLFESSNFDISRNIWRHIYFVVLFCFPLWSSGQSSWLQIQRSRFDSGRYQIFWVVGLERGPSASWVELRSYLKEKVAAQV